MNQLSKHKLQNHAINLEGRLSLFRLFYNFLLTELQVLQDYIKNNLSKKFI